MAFTDPNYVSEILDGVLTELNAAFDDANRPFGRAVRVPSDNPAWDCEMLAVWPRMRIGNIENRNYSVKSITRHFRHILEVHILAVRCLTLSRSGIPSPDSIDDDGDVFAQDMWILERAIGMGVLDGTLFPSGQCTVARVLPMQPLPAQGGYSGIKTTIEVAL